MARSRSFCSWPFISECDLYLWDTGLNLAQVISSHHGLVIMKTTRPVIVCYKCPWMWHWTRSVHEQVKAQTWPPTLMQICSISSIYLSLTLTYMTMSVLYVTRCLYGQKANCEWAIIVTLTFELQTRVINTNTSWYVKHMKQVILKSIQEKVTAWTHEIKSNTHTDGQMTLICHLFGTHTGCARGCKVSIMT